MTRYKLSLREYTFLVQLSSGRRGRIRKPGTSMLNARDKIASRILRERAVEIPELRGEASQCQLRYQEGELHLLNRNFEAFVKVLTLDCVEE